MDELEPIYNSSVLIQDIALKTFWEQWTIETGGERGSGRSVLAEQHDDNDDVVNSVLRQKTNKFLLAMLAGLKIC